jgi:hypothetical protein
MHMRSGSALAAAAGFVLCACQSPPPGDARSARADVADKDAWQQETARWQRDIEAVESLAGSSVWWVQPEVGGGLRISAGASVPSADGMWRVRGPVDVGGSVGVLVAAADGGPHGRERTEIVRAVCFAEHGSWHDGGLEPLRGALAASGWAEVDDWPGLWVHPEVYLRGGNAQSFRDESPSPPEGEGRRLENAGPASQRAPPQARWPGSAPAVSRSVSPISGRSDAAASTACAAECESDPRSSEAPAVRRVDPPSAPRCAWPPAKSR